MIDLYQDTPALEDVVNQTGYKSLRSLMFLHHLVKNADPEFVLELGTGFGCSSIFMALAFNGKQIFSVDDYRGDTTLSQAVPQGNLEKCGVADKVTLVHQDARFFIGAPNPDLVFMDASHNKVDLLSEYAAIESALPENHIIVIDDLFSTDVKEFAVDLLKKDCYDLCLMPKFHDGMAVLTSYGYASIIMHAIVEGARYA